MTHVLVYKHMLYDFEAITMVREVRLVTLRFKILAPYPPVKKYFDNY